MFDTEGFRAINKPKPLEHRRICYLMQIYNLSVDKRKKARSILHLKRAQQTQRRDFFFVKDSNDPTFLASQWTRQLDNKLRLLKVKGYPGHTSSNDLQLIVDSFSDLKQKTFLCVHNRLGKRLKLQYSLGVKYFLDRVAPLLLKKPFSKKFNEALFLQLCKALDEAEGESYNIKTDATPQQCWQVILKNKQASTPKDTTAKATLYQELYSQYEMFIEKEDTECTLREVQNERKILEHESAGLELCKKITQSSVDQIDEQDDILKSIHQLRKQTQDIVRNLSRRLSPS